MTYFSSDMMNYRLIFVFLIYFVTLSHAYNVYYVENACKPEVVSPPVNITVGKSDSNSSGILMASKGAVYSRGLNCSISLIPPPEHGIVVSIRILDLATQSCQDSLVITDTKSTFVECRHRIIDPYEQKSFIFPSAVEILFQSNRSQIFALSAGFQLTFTAYSKPANNETCNSSDAFACNNRLCIWNGLKCDGHNNCGDNSDEEFSDSACGYNGFIIHYPGLVLFMFMMLCLIFGICCLCCRRRRTAYTGVILTSSGVPYRNAVTYGTYRSDQYFSGYAPPPVSGQIYQPPPPPHVNYFYPSAERTPFVSENVSYPPPPSYAQK